MAAKQEFESRFAKHKDELEWLFMELYHNREGLEVLEREMAEAYNARSAELKALDKARSADPEWYKRGNMFGMTMYTDLFAGNLKELAKKLPYLKELKLTYLHLMPLLQMPHPHNDGGYAVEDFDTVDPALGTNKDLENLTRELRKAGISLCLDFVMNHTASTHRWAMAAKAGDPWFQAYYHLYEDRTIPDQYEQTVPQVFPNTAPGNFTWCEEMHKWVLTHYHGETPFLLSGGLKPESLDALLNFSHPRWAGIDLNSGFEQAPGLKDAAALSDFIDSFKQNKYNL